MHPAVRDLRLCALVRDSMRPGLRRRSELTGVWATGHALRLPPSQAAHLAPHLAVKKLWLASSTTSPSQYVTTGLFACGTFSAHMLPDTRPRPLSSSCARPSAQHGLVFIAPGFHPVPTAAALLPSELGGDRRCRGA